MSKPVKNLNFDKITLRLPKHLHQSLKDLATHKGTNVNSEILIVLMQEPIEQRLESMSQQLLELKAMMKDVLEVVKP